MLTDEQNKKWFCATWLMSGVVVSIACCLLLACPTQAGTIWLQQQKLLASDGATNDYFGVSVSINGDYAIVGAYRDDSQRGSAYIFKLDGENWSQQQKLTADDGAASDYFGYSVSISGDYAIVGAYGDNSQRGSAYIFKRDGESWSQQQKLLASDGASDDYFGCSVSISGDYAIIGAYGDGSDVGAAYIFKRDGTNWVEQAKLIADDGTTDDRFGRSVSISGDYAIAGAANYGEAVKRVGSAYIFMRDGASWSQQQKLIPLDGAEDDYFGISVFMSGDKAIVGSYFDDDNGDNSGSAYIFGQDVAGDWVLQRKLTASDGAADDSFGYSVSISGDCAIAGAVYDDDSGTSSGSAYVFVRCPSADLSEDCFVDFTDFAVMAAQWLQGY